MMLIATWAREYFGKSSSLNTVHHCIKKCNLKLYYAKRAVANKKCKNQPLWWYGGASVPTAWVICIYVKVPFIRRLMLEFWRDICCRQDIWLFPGTPCLFQQDNAWPHSAQVTTAWLRRHRVRVLDWPACSPDLSPIENVWRIMKMGIRQRQPRTVEQLKSCIHQEWAKICKTVTISSVPKQFVYKCN